MLLFSLHSHACISSLYSHWHWFSAFFGINRLYKSLIVNSISLESGRGVTQEKVWIGWEVPEAIGMCFDSLSSFSLLVDIVMIAFVGWWSHVLSKEGFNFLKLLQQSTLQKTKKLTSSVKAPVTRLWSVHVVIWWNMLQRALNPSCPAEQVRRSSRIRSTAPHCDRIFWNNASVGMVRNSNGNMHSIDPSLFRTDNIETIRLWDKLRGKVRPRRP